MLEQINTRAKEEADRIIQTAYDSAAAQRSKADNELKLEYDKRLNDIRREAELAVSGQRMLLRLETQKAELKVKRQIIDEVYAKVIEKINSLSDNDYRDFVGRSIAKYAQAGDKIIISKDEKRLDDQWLNVLASRLKLQLCFDNERHSDVGGVILRGSKYDKNLTVSALIEGVRKATESKVAEKLFG